MSLQDPISDMLTRIRNAQAVGKHDVVMPWSRLKQSIADLLVEEGYLRQADKVQIEGSAQSDLVVALKYHNGQPVIDRLKRISRPGLRHYRGCDDLPEVDNGLGIAVISTPAGLMSSHNAKKRRLGGEVLFEVC